VYICTLTAAAVGLESLFNLTVVNLNSFMRNFIINLYLLNNISCLSDSLYRLPFLSVKFEDNVVQKEIRDILRYLFIVTFLRISEYL